MTRIMYKLGPIDRIPPGEGRFFHVGGQDIVIFRTREDVLHAVQALCPHRGGPLADGIIGDAKVICPLHSYKFNLVTGQPLGNDCAALEVYSVRASSSRQIILEMPKSRGSEQSEKGNASEVI